MASFLTLARILDEPWRDVETPLPPGYEIRACRRSDALALGRLYFATYAPGVAAESLADAVADIDVSFDDGYGPFWFEGSGVIEFGDALVAALLAVRRAPWDDVPDGPFVIEVFTDRSHRRHGLARLLLARTLALARSEGERVVALRVDPANLAARALYSSLGFRQLDAHGLVQEA